MRPTARALVETPFAERAVAVTVRTRDDTPRGPVRRRVALSLGAVALGAATLLAWTRSRRAPPAPRAPAALAVQFAGCAEVRVGPICAASASPLTLWVPGFEPPALAIDGAPITARLEAAPGGHRVALSVPPGAAALTVTLGEARWRLALAPAPPPVPLDTPPAELAARAQAAVGAQRARLSRALGRLELRRGEPAGAVKTLATARAAALAAGLDSEARLAAAIAAHASLVQGRPADARAALSALPPPPPGDAYGAYVTAHARASVDRATGDLRAAARGLAEAAAVAERVGLDAEARASRHEEATLLGDLGRVAASVRALERLERALPDDAGPCERGDVRVNLGWARVRAQRAEQAVADIEAALRIYAECERQPAFRRSIARVNLAVAQVQLDAPEAAAAALVGAEAAGGPEVAAWRMIVEGRLARRRGDRAAAEAAFAELDRRARAAASTGLRWRAALERGLTAEAACDWPRAAALYREAEGLLFDASLRIAADAGRTRFLADRSQSATHLVRALLAQGRAAAAFDAARRARRRVLLGFSQHARLAGLPADRRARWEAAYAAFVAARTALEAAAAEDWDRSAAEMAVEAPDRRRAVERVEALLDEMATLAGRSADRAPLRPFTPDVPALGWFPAPGNPSACPAAEPAAWYGFAAIDGAVVAAALGDVKDPLAPFAAALRPALETARRVELLPTGPLRDRDLHLLSLDGVSLSARLPVVWRLDGPGPSADRTRAHAALVVVDPRVDLAGARAEGRAVAERLRRAGWSVERLEGTAVTGEALRGRMAGVDLFHYAGHAVAEGLDGWRSAFLLAEGALSAGELLTLTAAPRWAVLAACETGRAPGEVSGIGLAHALLAVGAEAVVATARPVTDAAGARFSAAFYGALSRASPEAGSIFDAYRAGLAASPADARGAFRLLVP